MIRYCFFYAKNSIDTTLLESVLSSSLGIEDLTYLSKESGFFKTSSLLLSSLEDRLDQYLASKEGNLCFVLTHSDDDFCKKISKEGSPYFPNRVVYLSDILFKFVALGDYAFIPLLKNYFRNLDHELLESAGSYLRNGLDAKSSCEELKIHRNTMNYRLNRFQKSTGLDLRDYHNALLLELYFQLIA